jgi:hypothetical protein
METHPPKLIERIAGALIPADCREHVLGDLHERYRSPIRYMLDVLTTLPFLVASQIRRTFRLDLFFAQACGLYIAFAGASLVADPRFLHDRGALVPLAIVIGVALVVFIFGDAYTGRQSPRSHEWMHVVFALALGYCVRSVVLAYRPEWALPMWVMLLGSAAAIPMLTLLRGFMRHGASDTPALERGNSIESTRMPKEYRKAWRVNWIWLMGALAVSIISPAIGHSSYGWNVGSGVFLILVIIVNAWRSMKGSIGSTSRYTSLAIDREPHRDEVYRKREGLLYWLGRGYFTLDSGQAALVLILALPLVIFFIGWLIDAPSVQDVSWVRVWIAFIGFLIVSGAWVYVRRISLRAARAMREELDSLDPDRKP